MEFSNLTGESNCKSFSTRLIAYESGQKGERPFAIVSRARFSRFQAYDAASQRAIA